MKRGQGSNTRRFGALPPMFGDPLALCRNYDGDLFYPQQYDSPQADAAKAVCRSCELRSTCLSWAIDNEPNHGIWAGLSPAERARIGTKVAA